MNARRRHADERGETTNATSSLNLGLPDALPRDDDARLGMGRLSKDQLVLSMLAVLGGEEREVNERDLFLACWHAFPNAMRWVDTALPNPDTFTAALRRLDAAKLVVRSGKQIRRPKGRTVKRPALDVGRTSVVKARISRGGLSLGGLTQADIRYVGALIAEPGRYVQFDAAVLIAVALNIRETDGRATDEGLLVETAFHKFPAVFAYGQRPEFPDTQVIRSGLQEARSRGLVDGFELTRAGRDAAATYQTGSTLRIDTSTSHAAGAFRLAQRIEDMSAYETYASTGSLVASKGDELFRALRLPPTSDTQRIATVLLGFARELTRIDKGEVVSYLFALAERHNPDVARELRDDIDSGKEHGVDQ